ncbi:RusA family crossover junction endodeoxyribonuclease [bacterium]|nr:RusA family crossover junction endodeoxyribonuclease [bacterium]
MWLKNFPFPPSDNKLHRNGRRPNQRFKTKEYLKFLELVEDYAMFAQKELEQPRRLSIANKRFSVKVDCYFERSLLITKKRTFKRIDAQNRLKALLDALASLMYCDDSTFWRVSVEKKVSQRNESYTDIYLEEYLEQ